MSPLPPPRRYHSLDFWRGVACLVVVMGHSLDNFMFTKPAIPATIASASDAGLWGLLFIYRLPPGVPMFFVISGYCITASAVSHRDRKLPICNYFFRRLRRIFPPLWIYLAIALPLISLLAVMWPEVAGGAPWSDPWNASAWQWAGSFTLTESWRYHVIGDPTRHYLIGHLWTLCYEEQFYLLVGLVLLVAPRYMFAVFFAVTIAVRLAASSLPHEAIHGFFFDGNWIPFAAGIAVYYAVHLVAWPLRVAICAALLLASQVQSNSTALGFAALLIAIHRWDGHLHAARWARPVSLCGVMCYSVYLTHQPLVIIVSRACEQLGISGPVLTLLVTLPVCVAATLGVSIVFHWYVERRFLNSAPRGSHAILKDASQARLDIVSS